MVEQQIPGLRILKDFISKEEEEILLQVCESCEKSQNLFSFATFLPAHSFIYFFVAKTCLLKTIA
jgi:hypothetical protein